MLSATNAEISYLSQRHTATIPPYMEATYQVTPEMLGLSWRRVLLHALLKVGAVLLFCLLAAKILYGRPLTGAIVGAAISTFICFLLVRPLSRTKLRLTDDSIEQSDGPVIRKDEVARVNEYNAGKAAGIEIIGNAKPRWLRDYRIFVPAALPEYEEVKRVVREWVTPEEWHGCEGSSR